MMMKMIIVTSIVCCVHGWLDAAVTGANCEQGVDIVFVQDTTETLLDDLPNIIAQIDQVVTAIETQFRHTRYAVVQFKDKPIEMFGFPGYDYCYKMMTSLTSDSKVIRKAFRAMYASGGLDLPEASFHALYDISKDEQIGWRPFTNSSEIDPARSAARIAVLITDAQPHLAGDYSEAPPFLANSSTLEQFENDCNKHDYPSPEQVKTALGQKGITLFTLVGQDPHVDAFSAWKWFNNVLLSQPSEFCSRARSDSSDFAESLIKKILLLKEKQQCEVVTTVAPPTSTLLTTSTGTTSTATTSTGTTSTGTTSTETTSTGTTSVGTTSSTIKESSTTSHFLTTDENVSEDQTEGGCHGGCGCGCGCGCDCGCHHHCHHSCSSGGGSQQNAPVFVFNMPPVVQCGGNFSGTLIDLQAKGLGSA